MSTTSNQDPHTSAYVYIVLSVDDKDGGAPQVLMPLYIRLDRINTPKLAYNFSKMMSYGQQHAEDDEVSYIGTSVNRNVIGNYIHFVMPVPRTIFGGTFDAKDEINPASRHNARGIVSMNSHGGLVNGHFNIFYAEQAFHDNFFIPIGRVIPQCFYLLDILESHALPSDNMAFGITIVDSGVCDELPGELMV